MGTRSSVGFILNGEYKAQYNHSDGYPGGVGQETVDELNIVIDAGQLEALKEGISKLELVDNDRPPTQEEMDHYIANGTYDYGVSTGKPSEWYALLRNVQGGECIPFIADGRMQHMKDGTDFITDSLFCEWAYIINFDTGMFEVWEGFQKLPDPNNRFGQKQYDSVSGDTYYPCKLIDEIPFGPDQKVVFDPAKYNNEDEDG